MRCFPARLLRAFRVFIAAPKGQGCLWAVLCASESGGFVGLVQRPRGSHGLKCLRCCGSRSLGYTKGEKGKQHHNFEKL